MSDIFGSIILVWLLIFILAMYQSCAPEKPFWSYDGQKHVLVLGDK